MMGNSASDSTTTSKMKETYKSGEKNDLEEYKQKIRQTIACAKAARWEEWNRDLSKPKIR